ncbi:MAG: ABC transporter permease subunit [Anaerolineales bacterium]|nr:MAG: ABC transporter permease subunit [Anaerolineales bacterium]
MRSPSADAMLPQPGRLADSSIFVIELLESAALGVLVAVWGLLLGDMPAEQMPRFAMGFAAGYLVLLALSILWQQSQIGRTLLTWLSLGSIFFFLLLLDLNREYVLARVVPRAAGLPRITEKTREWLANLSWLAYIFLYAPIVILIVFSFNAATVTEGGRVLSTSVWKGFTFNWYSELAQNTRIIDAAYNTLVVATISTVIATTIGTMTALGMERYNFFGKLAFDATLYLPIIIPDIVMALSLILFFVLINLGPWTLSLSEQVAASTILPEFLASFLIRLIRVTPIIIAHVAFNISFVAIVVRARLADFDRTLEEAAQDLYANEWQTFRRVTLPLIMPGIIGGALLAFTLSIDDFVITFFVSGPGATTLPVRVYSMIRIGVTPEVNAVSAVMLIVSIVLLVLSLALQRR